MPTKSSAAGRRSTTAKKGSVAGRKHSTAAKKSTVAKKPVAKKAAGKKPATKKKTARKPAAAKKPSVKKTAAARKPAAKKSTVKKSAAPQKPAAVKKTAKPAAKKPAATKKPAVKKTAAARKSAAAKKPAATKKPAVKKTAAAKKRSASRPKAKAGVLKKMAKALSRPKKKPVPALSSLQKVLAVHGVERSSSTVRPPFPAYRGTMPYIFISYSHADMKEVFSMIKHLNSSRYRIWFDEGIEPGNEWPEVVGRAVLGCSQFIVFMSPTAVESRNVRNEINLATSADKNIIVIYLKNTTLSEGLLLQIGTVQYFNKFEMTDKEFADKLKRVLSNDLHN